MINLNVSILIAKAVEEIVTYRDQHRLEKSFGNEHHNVGTAALIEMR